MRRFKKIMAMITSLALIAGMLPIVPTKTVEAATTRYEAEGANYGTNTLQNGDWYSSTSGGAVVGLNGVWEGNEYNAVNWTVNVAKTGKYTLTVGYCTVNQVELKAKVNDGEWKLFNEADSTTLVLPASPGWNVASTATLEVDLTEGSNTIAVSGPIVDWNANWFNVYGQVWGPSCNLDYIEISESTSTTKTGAELVADGSIKMVGRSMTNGTAATFDWTASGFEFEYTGSGDIKATITSSWGASNDYAELEINVDGVKTRSTVTGTQTITLASGLTNGKHTIKVNKVNEAGFGLAQLDRIQYPVDGQLKATATKKLKLEVIGDSITCGNQIDASNSDKEDGMGSYAYLLAQKFNAELNIESVTGRGLIAGWAQENYWGLDTSAEMNTIYDYTSYFRNKQTKWDTSSYNPDLIIVNLGNNDLGPATGVSAEQYCNAVVSFSNELRTAYPDAYILWVYGIFVNRDHSDNIATAISGLNDSKIMYKYMDQYNGGADDHPNYEQHITIANVLESYIIENTDLVSDNKGDNDTDTDVDTVVRYEAENATHNGKVESGDYYANCSNKGVVGLWPQWINNSTEYAYISQNVNVSKAGKYKITLHYCAPVASEFMISVNSGNWNYFDDEADTVGHVAPATGDWNIVGAISTVVELNEGNNNIKISGPIVDNQTEGGNFWTVYNEGNIPWSNANLDCFDVSRYIEKCDISIDGTNVAQIEKGKEYTLPSDSSLGYLCGDTAYKAGTKITVNGDMAFTAIGDVSFDITGGASIRYMEGSGLRFQAKANAKETVLSSKAVSVGMLITSNDLFTQSDNSVLTKDSTYRFIDVKNDGTWYNNTKGLYCGSIVNIPEVNYKRSFIGRAYLTITYSDESTETVYSDMTDSRNINEVAIKVKDNGYKNVPEDYHSVIDNYANAN